MDEHPPDLAGRLRATANRVISESIPMPAGNGHGGNGHGGNGHGNGSGHGNGHAAVEANGHGGAEPAAVGDQADPRPEAPAGGSNS